MHSLSVSSFSLCHDEILTSTKQTTFEFISGPIPDRVLFPSETLWAWLLPFSFCWCSGPLNSHQHVPELYRTPQRFLSLHLMTARAIPGFLGGPIKGKKNLVCVHAWEQTWQGPAWDCIQGPRRSYRFGSWELGFSPKETGVISPKAAMWRVCNSLGIPVCS